MFQVLEVLESVNVTKGGIICERTEVSNGELVQDYDYFGKRASKTFLLQIKCLPFYHSMTSIESFLW